MQASSQDPRDITADSEVAAVRVTFWSSTENASEEFRLLEVSGYDELVSWIAEHRDGREVVVQFEPASFANPRRDEPGTYVFRLGPEVSWA